MTISVTPPRIDEGHPDYAAACRQAVDLSLAERIDAVVENTLQEAIAAGWDPMVAHKAILQQLHEIAAKAVSSPAHRGAP